MILEKYLPLISLDDANHTYKLGQVMVEAGFHFAEVVFRTDATIEIIKTMSQVEGLIVGAGTVVNVKQIQEAIGAGAQFIVSPAINHEVIQYCLKNNIPIYPGVITPSEIEICKSYGLTTLKLFPAGVFGGVKLLKALSGPYPSIKFIPTGGVDLTNLSDYIQQPNVVCVGGSFIIDKQMVKNQDWQKLKEHLERMKKINESVSNKNI